MLPLLIVYSHAFFIYHLKTILAAAKRVITCVQSMYACREACEHTNTPRHESFFPSVSVAPSFHQFPLHPLARCLRTHAHTPVGLVVLFVVVVQNAQVVVRQRLRPRFVRMPARKPADTQTEADKLFLKFAAGDFKHKHYAAANCSVHHSVHLGPCYCPACVYARALVWKFIFVLAVRGD